ARWCPDKAADQGVSVGIQNRAGGAFRADLAISLEIDDRSRGSEAKAKRRQPTRTLVVHRDALPIHALLNEARLIAPPPDTVKSVCIK
ncbi:MAG: hypothetical protein MUO70_07305, partial [Euryarchaeota archaeon]|nr:hypothetical protein [Euryarchaeota archaeon]